MITAIDIQPYQVASLLRKLGVDTTFSASCSNSTTRHPRKAPAPSESGPTENSRTPPENRHNTLLSLAASMRGRGLSDETLWTTIRAENERRFSKPLPNEEVDSIVGWVLSLPAESEELLVRRLNEVGNADGFVTDHAHLIRYCPDQGKWLHWTGHHWQRDETGRVQELAKNFVQRMFDAAQAIPDKDLRKLASSHATRSNRRTAISSMLELANSDPRITVRVQDLDRDPLLLGVANGVVDLRTGQLRDGRRPPALSSGWV